MDVKSRVTDESLDKSKIWKLTEINEQAQCRSLRLPDNLRTTKVRISIIIILQKTISIMTSFTKFSVAMHMIDDCVGQMVLLLK